MSDQPRALLTADALRERITAMGREIRAAYGDDPILCLGILKGSFVFLSDLVRALHVPVMVDFLAISKFEPDSGRVRLVKDLDLDVSGRDVVLVEDIVDTGLTLGFLLGELGRRGPSSLEVCTLLDKSARRILPVELRFRGFEVPDVFVLCGLVGHVYRPPTHGAVDRQRDLPPEGVSPCHPTPVGA